MCCLRSASLLTMSIHAGDVIGVLLLRLLHGHAVFGVGIGCQIFRFFQRGGNIDAGKQQREGQQDAARRRVRLVLAQHGDQREKRREGKHQREAQADIKGQLRRCGLPFVLQQQPEARLRQREGQAQADPRAAADQQICKIDAAAPVPGDELVAHGAAGMLVPDEKRREDRGQNRREDDIDEQRVVHRPDLAVMSG